MYQSILPSVAIALFSRVMGPFSLGSPSLVAKKFTSAGSMRPAIVLLGLGKELLIVRAEVEQLVLADRSADGAAELLLGERR